MVDALGTGHQLETRLQVRILSWLQNLKAMKERKYIVKIAGQYIVLSEVEYEKYLIYGRVK